MCSAPKVTPAPATALLPPAVPPAPLAIPGVTSKRSTGLSALRIAQKLNVAPGASTGLTVPTPATSA